jgi:hypothetical protein
MYATKRDERDRRTLTLNELLTATAALLNSGAELRERIHDATLEEVTPLGKEAIRLMVEIEAFADLVPSQDFHDTSTFCGHLANSVIEVMSMCYQRADVIVGLVSK